MEWFLTAYGYTGGQYSVVTDGKTWLAWFEPQKHPGSSLTCLGEVDTEAEAMALCEEHNYQEEAKERQREPTRVEAQRGVVTDEPMPF
jgi:hypothetical protein